jgi:thymidine phosphorylase
MHLLIPEIIRSKRDGKVLSPAEIRRFIEGVTSEEVTDAQIAAFSMAAFFQDLNLAERTELTQSMRDSGEVLQWDRFRLDGPVVDKHSTGGIGDAVSLILAPILAACGGFVPMIAGRGLAHTGGTIDKLESIPGYSTQPSVGHFQKVVASAGMAIAGQTADLAPADRRMYATRDVTATVEQYGLITASILSKKLAAGLEHLVMDIKVGSGAFMKDLASARILAQSLCSVGTKSGMPTQALLTSMDQPLAHTAGNAVEVREAVSFLRGDIASERLDEVTRALATMLLLQSGLASSHSEAKTAIERALHSGRAAECFGHSIASMGGPTDFMECSNDYLKICKGRPVFAHEKFLGQFVNKIDTRELGMAVVALGGGRTRANQSLDHSVGCSDFLMPGHKLMKGLPLAWVHARDETTFLMAQERIRGAYTFLVEQSILESSMLFEETKA